MTDTETFISDSIQFGNILTTRSEDCVSARFESDDSTVVRIARTGPRTRRDIPIGTRDSKFLTAHVNDHEIKLIPGMGRLFRRSYRITVDLGDRFLSLRPHDLETYVLVGGKPHEMEKRLADLKLLPDGSVDFLLASSIKVVILNKTVVPPEMKAEDALIGAALATAFGTGSMSFTSIVTGFIGAAIPG
ncbi:hypothetical protein [Nocardia colli]|uniref:hypothetical protein n=1 Tax=Nocardia colli TaxID=2545717 RepID=UPI0035DF8DA7